MIAVVLNIYLRTAFTDFEVNLRALAVTAIVTVAVATAVIVLTVTAGFY